MYKFRFSGHETFACRYAWLPKAVAALKEKPRLFSDEEQAIVDLGIGKNMVRATRFWMQATDTVAPNVDGGYSATDFGNQIFGEFGLDRHLEDRQTLWLLHWKLLMQNEPLFAWDFLVNRWHQPNITREAAVTAFEREAAKLDKKLSRVTLEQHFDVFLHTYIPTRGRKGSVLEDNLDCPLAELELIEKVVDKQADSGGRHETVYAFRRDAKPDVSAETFIYCLFDYWAKQLPHEKTLTFRQVAVEANSIGQVFKMPEWEVRERLDNLEADSGGLFKYDESVAQQKVICQKELQDVSAERLLSRIYKPDSEFAPFQTGAGITQQSLFAD